LYHIINSYDISTARDVINLKQYGFLPANDREIMIQYLKKNQVIKIITQKFAELRVVEGEKERKTNEFK